MQLAMKVNLGHKGENNQLSEEKSVSQTRSFAFKRNWLHMACIDESCVLLMFFDITVLMQMLMY